MNTAGPLYIDVSEIHSLSRTGDEVTGVSRVVLEIAYELCTRCGAIPVYCDPVRHEVIAVDPSIFADGMIYDRRRVAGMIGSTVRYREPMRYPSWSLRRLNARIQNGIRARFAGSAVKRGSAIRGRADVSRCTILCLGSLPSSFRTLECIRRSGGRAKAAVMLHDVMRIEMNRDAPRSDVRRLETVAVEGCNAMGVIWMANSQHTRRDVECLVADGLLSPLNGGIEVVPLAHEIRDLGEGQPILPPIVDRPYLLTVGGLDGRKNGRLFCDALMSLYDRYGPDAMHRVVCAGNNPVSGIRGELKDGERYTVLAPFFDWVDSPDHATLRVLYANATALVFPSLYEGFGLPVGEALWLGTPVFAANAASIPEVAADLARYFDPQDSEALAALLHQTFTEPGVMEGWRMQVASAGPTLRRWHDVALHMQRLLEREPGL